MTQIDLVVQGGGSNICGLAGAAYELGRKHQFARVAGTSAGGLLALALAFKVPEDRLRAMLLHYLADNLLIDGDLGTFLTRWGWCRGDVLRKATTQLIGEGARLGDALVPVAVVVGDLYMREPRILTSWGTPNALVADVAVATSAIPGVFAPQTIRGLDVGNRLHCDGGVAMNFALGLFDDDPRPTIGIRPAGSAAKRPEPVRNLQALLFALAGMRQWAADHSSATGKENHVVVDVVGGDGLDFSLSAVDIDARWKAGVQAAQKG